MTVTELAIALSRASNEAWRVLTESAGLFLTDDPLPDRATLAAGDQGGAEALARRLIEAARFQPRVEALLRRLITEAGHANVVAGDVHVGGHVIQAQEIHGSVHIHGTPDAFRPLAPHQLISTPTHFTDRETDLAALEAIRTAHRGAAPLTVVVSGVAGVGKTSLATYWLREVATEYPDGQLYADLRGHSGNAPVSPGEVLGTFLRAVGVERVPVDMAEQAALWRTVTVGSRIAVLLDNALSAAQVRPLLPGAPTALVTVTSRRRLPGLHLVGAHIHVVDPLPDGPAVELLGRRLGSERVAREHEAARQLVRFCAGLPLAVCVVAARLAVRPRQPLSKLVGAMRREERRLASFDIGGEQAVQAALDDSYASLPPEAARGYRRLGLLPTADFDAHVVAAAGAFTDEEAERLLDQLVEANLVDELAPGRCRFHDLVRLHAAHRALADDSPDLREETERRVLDYYLAASTAARALLSPTHRRLRRDYLHSPTGALPFDSAAEAVAWLDIELRNLMVAVRLAAERGWDATTWQIVDSMQPAFLRLRPYDFWIEAHRLGLDAARRAGHREGVSRMLTTGGSGLYNAGLHDEAIEWFREALAHAEDAGDRRAQAQALHGLGQSHRLAGRLEQAAALFTEALAIREAIGYTRGAALTRVCLGDVALSSGRPAEAVALLGRARDELLAVPDAYDAARALAFLGLAHAQPAGPAAASTARTDPDGRSPEAGNTSLPDFDTAERHLRQALAELEAAGSAHWQARVVEWLGESAENRGDVQAAAERYRQSLARYTTLSPRDAQRLQGRLRTLGER